MKLTINLIKDSLIVAANVIKNCYPNFKYENDYQITISSARSYWAKICPGGKKLRVSNCFDDIKDEQVAIEQLTGTLVHELIHTIPGCLNHGNKFLYICNLINFKYPQYHKHLQRCANMAEFGIKAKPNKYQIKCPYCQHVYNYKRKPNWSERIIETHVRCGVCNHKGLKLITL